MINIHFVGRVMSKNITEKGTMTAMVKAFRTTTRDPDDSKTQIFLCIMKSKYCYDAMQVGRVGYFSGLLKTPQDKTLKNLVVAVNYYLDLMKYGMSFRPPRNKDEEVEKYSYGPPEKE